QVARVLRVERDRVGAAQLVTEVLVDHGDRQFQLLHFGRQAVFHHATELDLAQPQVPVRVTDDLAVTSQLSGGHHRFQTLFTNGLHQALGQHRNPVGGTHAAPLEDGTDEDIDHLIDHHSSA